MDIICVKIHLPKSKNLFVVTSYRPPTETPSDFFHSLDMTLEELPASSKSILTAKHSTWWDRQTTDNAGVLLGNMAFGHRLSQLVEGPTRAAGTHKPLNWILSSLTKQV